MLKNRNVNPEKEILMDLLGGGYLDIPVLISYYNIANELDFIDGIDREDEIFLNGGVNFNSLLYYLMDKIFHGIVDEARKETEDKKILKKLEDLEDSFSPYTNFLDSSFDNIFDELNFEKSKDEVVEELLSKI